MSLSTIPPFFTSKLIPNTEVCSLYHPPQSGNEYQWWPREGGTGGGQCPRDVVSYVWVSFVDHLRRLQWKVPNWTFQKQAHEIKGDSRDPQQWDPLMGSFPYYSHSTPIRIPKDMGMVWEAYHKGVPLLGVPENSLNEMSH